MILPVVLLSKIALAEPAPASSLARALTNSPLEPMVSLSCAPSAEVFAFLATIADATGGFVEDQEGAELLRRLSTVEGLDSLGVDGQGAVTLILAKGATSGELDVPFSGSPDQAVEFLRSIDTEPVPAEGFSGAWWVPEADGGRYPVLLRNGILQFRLEEAQGVQWLLGKAVSDDLRVQLELLEGLPEGRGCAVQVKVEPGTAGRLSERLGGQGFQLAGFVPFAAGEEGLVRVRAPELAALPWMGRGQPPVEVRSGQPPAIMLSLGFSVEDLMSIPGLASQLKLKPAHLERVVKWFNVGPGAVLGIFGDPRKLEIVAVLPLDEAHGPVKAKAVTRKMARLARRTDTSVLYREPQAIGLLVGERIVHAQMRDGRVVLGLDSQRVLDVAHGAGTAWGGPASQAFAQEWAVAMMVNLDGGAPAGVLPAMGAGLRSRGQYLELGFRLQDPLPLPMLVGMLAPALGAGLEGASGSEVPPPEGVEEISATMEAIALAQQVHHSVHGAYLALPPAPRRADQADPTAVPWMRRAPWDRLGWAPEPPFTAGVFWVELDEESGGYTVFGECDLDGDGVRAQFRLRADEAMERLSPADVY